MGRGIVGRSIIAGGVETGRAIHYSPRGSGAVTFFPIEGSRVLGHFGEGHMNGSGTRGCHIQCEVVEISSP